MCWHHRENKRLLIYRNIKSQDDFDVLRKTKMQEDANGQPLRGDWRNATNIYTDSYELFDIPNS